MATIMLLSYFIICKVLVLFKSYYRPVNKMVWQPVLGEADLMITLKHTANLLLRMPAREF